MPDPPPPQSHDVLVRTMAVGVCGSDVHYYRHGRIGEQVVTYPFVMGHEMVGVVERVGDTVMAWRPGDRVAVDPGQWCGECDQCRLGRRHTCRNLKFMGCPGQASGALAEFVVVPERCCFRLPDSLTWEEGVLSEPLSIALHALRLVPPVQDKTIAVLGAGPIGLCVALAARAQGCKQILMTDPLDYRLRVAQQLGADWVGNPERQDILQEILAACPEGVGMVFECCGQQDAIDQGIRLLAPGGELVIAGIPEADRVSVPIHRLRRQEITIRNVRRQCDCTEEALARIADGSAPVGRLATHRFPLDRAAEALETVMAYRDGVVKAIVTVPAASL